MIPARYPCPLAGGSTADEYALACDHGRGFRLLIVPALFEEASRMRRFTVEVMRRLDGAGIDSFLPDLPGCNESRQLLAALTPEDWQDAMTIAAEYFGATHVLGIRGGALVLPGALPGWCLAPMPGTTLLRQMLRARIIAGREAGLAETHETLLEEGLAHGIEIAGYRLGADFVHQFAALAVPERPMLATIMQDMLGGGGLWLRAEPGENAGQADSLAAVLTIGMKT